MGKQGRLFAIATLVIAIVFLHSGKALECYQCNSLDDEGCESGPLEDYIVDCSATTTTEPTTTTTAEPTTTTTEPTTTTTAQSSSTEGLALDNKNNLSDIKDGTFADGNVHDRRRRSILRSFAEDKPEWACAVMKQNLKNNTVIVRRCVLNTVENCPSSVINGTEVNNCVEFQKCDTDKCNSATAVSINTTILGFLVLSWTAFTFIN
nr:PREDICTED: uncharacterized protein LOC105677783 [Linepithema humile]